MSKAGERIFSVLLWFFGGTLYFLLEVAYKTATGHPERISWTMLVLAIFLCIPIERCGAELPWNVPLLLQGLACAVLVTAVELVAGLILNVWLGLDIWDYSGLPGNLWGQICIPFFGVWWVLCLMFIPVFDWIRYSVDGKEKPHYVFWWKGASNIA